MGCYGVPRLLREVGLSIEIHKDHFKDDEEDKIWLKAVGERGWVILSKDNNILRRDVERQAIIDASASAFFLRKAGLTAAEMAAVFTKAIPAIEKALRAAKGPVVAVIRAGGTLRVLDGSLRRTRRLRKRRKVRPRRHGRRSL